MKDYKVTRKQVETLVNTKVLPALKSADLTNKLIGKINLIAFLYQCGNIDCLEALSRLITIYLTGDITPEQAEKLQELFK